MGIPEGGCEEWDNGMLGTVPNVERALSEWQLLCLVMSFPGGSALCQHSGPCRCGGVEL